MNILEKIFDFSISSAAKILICLFNSSETYTFNIPKVSPSVQLGAINSLLDRSGYQTITKIEDVTGRKTDAELREELKHLLSTIAVVRGPYDPSDTNGSGSIQ